MPVDREKVRAAFAKFDKDGSGKLSVDELVGIFTRPGGGDPMTEEEARAYIAKHDKNGDGELDIDEFLDAMMSPARPPPPPPPAEDEDEPCDAPNDLDDLDDLDAMASERHPMLDKAKMIFESLDKDMLGTLSKAELREGLLADTEAAAFLGAGFSMAEFDLDGDDEITWTEFEQLVEKKFQAPTDTPCYEVSIDVGEDGKILVGISEKA